MQIHEGQISGKFVFRSVFHLSEMCLAIGETKVVLSPMFFLLFLSCWLGVGILQCNWKQSLCLLEFFHYKHNLSKLPGLLLQRAWLKCWRYYEQGTCRTLWESAKFNNNVSRLIIIFATLTQNSVKHYWKHTQEQRYNKNVWGDRQVVAKILW